MSLWPLFAGIVGRPVLLAAVAVVLLGAWGVLGSYLGLPGLFWHQDGLTQVLAGLGCALLFGQLCFVSYLLDGDHPSLKDEPRPAPPGLRRFLSAGAHRLMRWVVPGPATDEGDAACEWGRLRWYLSVTWLPLLFFLVLPALVYWTSEPPPNGAAPGERFYTAAGGVLVWEPADGRCLVFPVAQRWYFLAGVAVAGLLTRYFVKAFHAVYARVWNRWKKELPAVVGRLPPAPLLHLLTALLFVLLFALCWDAPTEGLGLLLFLWAAAHGLLVSVFRVARVPEEERWKHLLAGALFGAVFAVYVAFLLGHWAAPQ